MVAAAPLYATFNLWRCPPYPGRPGRRSRRASEPSPGPLARWLLGGRRPRPLQRRELFVIGIDLDKNPFREPIRSPDRGGRASGFGSPDRVLLNELSHPDFGWQLRDQFEGWELGNHAVKVVGGFPMLRGFAADATVICGDRTSSASAGFPRDRVSFGLLKVRPGTIDRDGPAPEGRAPARRRGAQSRRTILRRENDHWVNQTSTGKIFAFGVLVAMIVAAVVVYQVLSNDIREHLPEYATLKAMGYSTGAALARGRDAVADYMLIAYVLAVVAGDRGLLGDRGPGRNPHAADGAATCCITLLLAVAVGFALGLAVPEQGPRGRAGGPVLRRCGTMDDPVCRAPSA